jgi:hypothetical protein
LASEAGSIFTGLKKGVTFEHEATALPLKKLASARPTQVLAFGQTSVMTL